MVAALVPGFPIALPNAKLDPYIAKGPAFTIICKLKYRIIDIHRSKGRLIVGEVKTVNFSLSRKYFGKKEKILRNMQFCQK